MPYQSIYENECNKSEQEMSRIIADLVKKPVVTAQKSANKSVNINDELIKQITGDNFQFDESAYRGAMVSPKKIGDLYNAGIRRVIAIDDAGSDLLEKECEKYGIDYYHFRLLDTLFSCEEYSMRKKIDNVTNLIQNMQKGNVYIGCEWGTHRTNETLLIDYLFNPKMDHDNTCGDRLFIYAIEDLYHDMTDSDKLKMGWTKEFEQTFLKRLGKLRK